jgi:ABC-type glycerol-3-phosphate transport system substrate-binding protein
MKRRFTFLAFVLLIALVGCGEKKPQAADQAEITIWWGNEDAETIAKWQEYYWDPYLAKHPEVKIDFVPVTNEQDVVRVQLAAGSGPDIFMADCFDIPDFADAGRILKLDDYARKYNWENKIYGWSRASATYKGSLYGVPHSSEATGLYYNNDLLKEYGLKVPTTREEFVNACETAIKKGKIALGYGFSDAAINNQWIFDHYLTAYAGAEGIAKLFTGKLKFTDPEIAGAWQQCKQDWDAGFINEKMSGAITGGEGRSMFENGNALFNPEGTWLSLVVVRPGTWTFDWGFAPWPSFKNGIPPAGGIGVGAVFCINAITKSPDVCADIVDSVYADDAWVAQGISEGLEILCTEIDTNKFPASTSKDVLETIDAVNTIASSPAVSYTPWSSYPAKTNIWLQENLAKLWYGEYSLDQFLKGAQAVLDAELAEGYQFVAY